MFIEHSCGDCKLKCIDCDAQICPKCLVLCPVGNRCKSCAQRFTSHSLRINFWHILRSFALAFIAGALFAVLRAIFFMPGFLMLIVVYLFGSFAGNIIFKLSGRKLGPKIAAVVAVGILAGSFCTPFGPPISLSLIIFMLGTLSPFLGWVNPFTELFRR